MKSLLLVFFLLVFLTFGLFNASKAQNTWDEQKLELANSAKDLSYLTLQEKEIIFYTNLARIDGALFADTYLEDYLKKNNIKNNK